MTSRHLSIRIDAESYERLERESHRLRLTRSELARMLLEEGLRMEAHPGIVFRPGPTGRRPALIDGPDIWEIVRLYKSIDATGEEAARRAAEWSSLRADQMDVAFRYYAEYRAEIDEWIQEADEYAEQAHAQWLHEQEALRK